MIGNKNEFGVELVLSLNHKNRGFARVWFGGKFLSTIYDEIYIKSYLLNLLDDIYKCEILDKDFKSFSEKHVFNTMNKYNEHCDSINYLLRGSTFTDCFVIFCFKTRGVIHLVWKKRENYNFPDVIEQGDQIFSYKITEEKYFLLLTKLKFEICKFI